MANITLGELRAKYPPEDREEYDRAYAAAALAGELAELVYNLRDRAGLTQAELARRMGTTQSSIARIESGGSLPTVEMLARLARAMGISLRLAAPGFDAVELGGAALNLVPDLSASARFPARSLAWRGPSPATGTAR